METTPRTIEVLRRVENAHAGRILAGIGTARFHTLHAVIAADVQLMAVNVRAVDHSRCGFTAVLASARCRGAADVDRHSVVKDEYLALVMISAHVGCVAQNTAIELVDFFVAASLEQPTELLAAYATCTVHEYGFFWI